MPNSVFFRRPVAAALIAIACTALPAQAAVLVTATSSVGNQHDYSGIGFKFRVNSAITISQLGVFDSDADGVAGGTTLWTSLFHASGSFITAASFTSNDPGVLQNFFRYKSIAPTTLAVGDYVLAGYGWDARNQEYNNLLPGANSTSFNANPLVTFLESRYGLQSPLVLAHTTAPTNPHLAEAFNAVNMQFTSAVPEPASLALVAAALGVLGLGRRQRRA